MNVAVASTKTMVADSGNSLTDPWLVVQTSSSTIICSIIPSGKIDIRERGAPPFSLRVVSSLEALRAQTEDAALDSIRRFTSFAFAGHDRGKGLAVDGTGMLVTWSICVPTIGQRWKPASLRSLGRAGGVASEHASPQYREDWRVCTGGIEGIYLVYNADQLFTCDTETGNTRLLYSATLHPRLAAKAPILSVVADDSRTVNPMFFICTLAEVICFDARNPDRPKLAWAHGRGPDPSLSLSLIPQLDFSCAVVSSSYSRLLRAYTAKFFSNNVFAPYEPFEIRPALLPGTLQKCAPLWVSLFELDDDWATEKQCSYSVLALSSTGALALSGLQNRDELVSAKKAALPAFPVKKSTLGGSLLDKWEEHAASREQGVEQRRATLLNHEATWSCGCILMLSHMQTEDDFCFRAWFYSCDEWQSPPSIRAPSPTHCGRIASTTRGKPHGG